MIPLNHSEVTAFKKYTPRVTKESIQLFRGFRLDGELYWVHLQPHLASLGYQLRPRYSPDWIPSWRGRVGPGFRLCDYEDALTLRGSKTIDALRQRDGSRVVLKIVSTQSQEIEIGTWLSSLPQKLDPRNHAVPILEVIAIPNDLIQALIVMPMLVHFNITPFRRLGELLEALQQYTETLQLLHENNIAHRDACYFNLMVDCSQLLPKGSHFAYPTSNDGISWKLQHEDRSQVKGLRYYLADFGLSTRYPRDAADILDTGRLGQDATVPELSLQIPYDPFKVDIYQLGNVFKKVVNKYEINGLEPLLPLLAAMSATDPNERPTPSQILTSLRSIDKKMRKHRIWKNDEMVTSSHKLMVKYLGYKDQLC